MDVLRRPLIVAAMTLVLLFQTAGVSALGLVQAYEAAVENDPAYRAAIHENRAGQEFAVIGRAALLPSLSANYAINQNDQDFTREAISLHRTYVSETGAIQLRQPIINFGAFAGYKQGLSKARQSDANFSVQSQELIVRLVRAYVDAGHAEDQLALAVAQLTAYAEQRQANERMLEKGEGTKTEVLETQAKFYLAEAQVLEAQDNLTNARHVLESVVGQEVTDLDPLSDNFPIMPMQHESLDEWEGLALENNPEIKSQRHAADVAREEISKQRAGHFPRLDLVAAVTRNKSDNPILVGIDAVTRSIGVQVNVPLYAGGSVNAITSQAASSYEKARADLDNKIRQITIELRKQYTLILTSNSRISALVKSVEAANFRVEATRKSIIGGVRTNLDFLHAQQQLFEAKRDLSRARYQYLLGYLGLRKAAGIVGMSDLHDIANYFISRDNSGGLRDTASGPGNKIGRKTIE